MATDSREDSRTLSIFESDEGAPEPITTTAAADRLGVPEDSVAERLSALADRGEVRHKDVGGSRVWWPAEALGTGVSKAEQRRRLGLFENMQDIASVGAWAYDIEADEGWGTDEVLRIHGREPEDHITPEESIEFYHPDDRQTIETAFERAVKENEPYDLELRLITADGDQRWVRTRGQAQYEDGEAVRVHGTIQDITERKHREQELEKERQFIQQALDGLDDVFYALDTDGTLERWNGQVSKALGYSESDLAETNAVEFFPEDEHETVLDAIDTILSDGEATIEADLLTAAGERRPYEFKGTRLTDADGTTTGIVGIGRDMTERLQRERRFRALVEESSDIISVVDADGNYQYQSPSVERILGYGPEEKIGDPADRYIHPDDREAVRETLGEWQADAPPTGTIEYRIRHADGSWRWMEASGNPELDNPAVEGYVINSREITERKEQEKELERKSRALKEAPVGIAITDPSQEDNPMIYVNQRFVDMTGYTRTDAMGENCRFLQGDQTDPEPVAKMRTSIDEERRVSVELRNERKDGTNFWNQVRIAPVRDDSGTVTNYVGFQQDVTERKEREQALEKRERILRELHAATREFYPPESETETAEFLVEFVEKAFGFEYVSVKQFDESTGTLEPAARTTGVGETGTVGSVSPGPNPVWEAYRRGESQIVDGETFGDDQTGLGVPVTQALVVPIGDFGVTLVYTTGDHGFDNVDTELIEVVTANAEATLQRLRSDRVRNELADQLSVQQAKAEELRGVIDTIQTIQQRLAASDSQDALETGVCEELTDTDRVDFAWVGRPQGGDTDLTPTAWAGGGRGYLDSINTRSDGSSLPAQRAAADRETYCIGEVASLVVDEAWAKEALSAELRSVASVPLVYDDVLYGVLTLYSREEDAFGQMYEHLFTDVASLLVNYSRLLGHRYSDSQGKYTELEFELADETYPVQRLAAHTDSRLRFDTVAENDAAVIRVLVTVLAGDATQVLGAAASINSIQDAAWFGDRDHDQLALTIQKPFLASVVGKHGGTLVGSVSEPSETRFRVELPRDTAKRPLLDSLSSRYDEIEPVAQRQAGTARVPGPEQVADILTERQYEVLNAAYHGGYYETPRGVTGADLAESFDISSPAIYNHLQAAHRTLLGTVFQSGAGISDETSGLNT